MGEEKRTGRGRKGKVRFLALELNSSLDRRDGTARELGEARKAKKRKKRRTSL